MKIGQVLWGLWWLFLCFLWYRVGKADGATETYRDIEARLRK